MRWHNILRTGLDFQEIACGRVSSSPYPFFQELMGPRRIFQQAGKRD